MNNFWYLDVLIEFGWLSFPEERLNWRPKICFVAEVLMILLPVLSWTLEFYCLTAEQLLFYIHVILLFEVSKNVKCLPFLFRVLLKNLFNLVGWMWIIVSHGSNLQSMLIFRFDLSVCYPTIGQTVCIWRAICGNYHWGTCYDMAKSGKHSGIVLFSFGLIFFFSQNRFWGIAAWLLCLVW